mmetsp:Transcript_650/g.602  ORF Transcript_650/g.602 Transcript_650/m.602 type:complete len:91 (+) Transcript_650:132-404(+)
MAIESQPRSLCSREPQYSETPQGAFNIGLQRWESVAHQDMIHLPVLELTGPVLMTMLDEEIAQSSAELETATRQWRLHRLLTELIYRTKL